MKAIVITKQGNPVAPNIEYQEAWPELADPGIGQVRIKALASALNHMDLWVGRGVPGLELSYPRISGCDACGTVEAVGAGVDEAWIGKRVIVNAATRIGIKPDLAGIPGSTLAPEYELIGEHHQGMHAERFLVPADNLAPVPDDCSPAEAAAYGLTMLTAYSMMFTKGELRPGQSVLITGIGGGVATSALALAKHRGCPAIVTSRHQWKLDKALALGADFAILDEGQDWSRQVRKLTGKRGVDMVVDSTGKATHLNCIKSLARGGAYVTPGCTTGPDATTDLARIFWNQLRLLGSTMGSNDEFREVVALFRTGNVRPVVDQVFKPDQAAKAWQRLEAGEQFGKIVIDWS
ncbi:MAG TPA: alcohol dehydrogenase [Phycisphaerales bacterium]|nr:alcohol dehydrogenase [Phycisphaerales bacterium]